MKTTDLNGLELEITDLAEAVKKAREFKLHHHENEKFQQSDKKLKGYWTDLYKKLTDLQKEKTNNPTTGQNALKSRIKNKKT